MALQHPNMTVAHRQLTAKEREILEKQVLVHVGIVLPDGTPHVSAMWVDLDDEDIILNTAEGRTKANVLRLGSPVALSVLDPENPYRNLGLRGRVVQVISEEQGAGAGINRLAKKYLGGPANRSLELVCFCVLGGSPLADTGEDSALWVRFRRRVDHFASSVTMIAYRKQNAHVAGIAKSKN